MVVTDDSERDIGREILEGILEIQRGGGRRVIVCRPFIAEENTEAEQIADWLAASMPVLRDVWDNEEDDVYDQLMGDGGGEMYGEREYTGIFDRPGDDGRRPAADAG